MKPSHCSSAVSKLVIPQISTDHAEQTGSMSSFIMTKCQVLTTSMNVQFMRSRFVPHIVPCIQIILMS